MKLRVFVCMLMLSISNGISAQLDYNYRNLYMNINDNVFSLNANYGKLYYGIENLLTISFKDKQNIKSIESKDAIINRKSKSDFAIRFLNSESCELKINGNQLYKITLRLTHFSLPEVGFKGVYSGYLTKENLKHLSKVVAVCDNIFECEVIGFDYYIQTDSMGLGCYNSSSTLDNFSKGIITKLNYGNKIVLTNVIVKMPDGGVLKVPNFTKKEYTIIDEEQFYKEKVLIDKNVLSVNKRQVFGLLHSDLRIKIAGNPTQHDVNFIKEYANTLNPLLETIKIKIVDYYPTITIYFNPKEKIFNNSIDSVQSNTFFPNIIDGFTEVYVNVSDREKLDKLLGRLTYLLTNTYYKSIILENNKISLITFDKDTVDGTKFFKYIYSKKGRKQIDANFAGDEKESPDRTLLIVILSLIFLTIFKEINEKYRYLNFIDVLRNRAAKATLYSLLIVQIPILLITSINYFDDSPYQFTVFLWNEFYFSLFAILCSLFLLMSDTLMKKIQSFGIKLAIDFFITFSAFFVSYQILYYASHFDFLSFSLMKWQWLYIPLAAVVYRFFSLYNQRKIMSLVNENQFELTKQKELKVKAELKMLQARINPHFLYNALNSIASLAHISAEKTEKMAMNLSKLFRYNINKTDNMFSSIQEEIDMISIYLEVEKQRFTERLEYSVHLNPELAQTEIPIFLIQPLVENAIKHGVSKITGKGIVKIKISKENHWLRIAVYDNGPAFPDGLLSGYGLQFTYDKLELLYKNNYEIRFINEPEKHIEILINQKGIEK